MGKLAGEFDLRCNFRSPIVGRLPAGGTGGNWKWYWKWKGADQWQGGWSVPELPGAPLHRPGVVQYVCIRTIYTRSNTHRPGEVQYVLHLAVHVHVQPQPRIISAWNQQCCGNPANSSHNCSLYRRLYQHTHIVGCKVVQIARKTFDVNHLIFSN